MSLSETMEQHKPMNDESFEQFTSIEDVQPNSRIAILDSIKIWPVPVLDLKLPDIEVDAVNWEWVWQFGCWAITDGNTTYEKDGWYEYCDNHKPKTGLHSESSAVVWPEGTPDGHIAVLDNINGDIYVVAPDHEFKSNEDVICVKQTNPVGTKADSGKPILGAIPPHAELAVARVLTFGAKKYSRGNWAHVENSDERYMDAALRHLNAHRRGENTDSETGESHLAHAICCLMFMLDGSES